jgi:KaiC/GvpD/RAD55 family RecA-like ATPase
MQQIDWIRIAPDVAKQLLGEPTKTSSNELRWGSKGSMALNLSEGTFYDHEEGVGGGVIDLIKHLNQDVNTVLKQYGYDLALHSNDSLLSGFDTPKNKTTSNAGSFSQAKIDELQKQAEVELKYSDNFMVLRHANLPMKYAPFSRNNDGTWSMKRPEGKLPIYFNNKGKHKPVIINEGEKALRGCEAIVGDALSSCTWHGGVNSWEKADWTPVFGKEIWIFPDNDSAGKECADQLSEHLRKKGCRNIRIIQPPEDFDEKDDLYDAYESGYFKSANEFINFVDKQKVKLPKGALRFDRADYVLSQVTNPDWLITEVFERNRLITVFGEPKSGKSFISIAMACAVARGSNFYGHNAEKAPVVYLAGEGVSGIRRRLAAYHKSEYGGNLDGAPLFLSNRGSRINEPEEYEKLETEINLLKQEVGQIGLIIFDTFQRCFSGDENSAQEVNKFVKAADQLIHDFECTVLLVHHTGRGNKGRARGSSVLDASIDGEFLVERKGTKPDDDNSMLVTMKQTKNKDGMGMAEKKFEFHEEALVGEGLDVTSGLLIETDVDIKSHKEIENDVDLKIADKMHSLALSIAKKDNCNPEDVYFTYKTFNNDLKGIHHLKNAKDEPYKKYTVDNSLRRMHKQNKVEKNKKGNGYRLVDADFTGFNKGV